MDEIVLLRIGRVVRTHGLAGALLIAPESEDPARLLELDSVFVGPASSSSTSYRVHASRLHHLKKHTGVLMELEKVSSIGEAEALVKSFVYAEENELPPLEDNQYFLDDLPGLEVRDYTDRRIGVVQSWAEYPGQLMLVIVTEHSKSLVPLVVPEIVSAIDIENGFVRLAELEGLVDG